MRKFIVFLVTLFLVLYFAVVNVTSVDAVQRVKGYTKKNGTYVQPHFKSPPNKSKFDNFSTKGNLNPYTGKKGTVDPFKFTPKKYR